MRLKTTYLGATDPFEGNHTLWMRMLPAEAKVLGATLTLRPADPDADAVKDGSASPKFIEVIDLRDPASNTGVQSWGATCVKGSNFFEVDFHARRTLVSVLGNGLKIDTGNGAKGYTLQVDMGGVFANVNKDGTLTPAGTLYEVPAAAGGELPGLTVSKFRLTAPSGDTSAADVRSVTVRSLPTNISARLGQMPPFWTRIGDLSDVAVSPDFSGVLAAFLPGATVVNGFFQVPLVIHSDSLCRLDALLEIEYLIDRQVLPPQLTDLKLSYGFSTLPSVPIEKTTVLIPRRAVPVLGGCTARVRGQIQPSRIALGPDGPEPGDNYPVTVSPDQALAQAFRPDREIAVTAVDLSLDQAAPGQAGLSISIVDDDDGKPSGAVHVRADVRVEKPLPGQTTWGSAALPAPFRAEANKRYWLVLQSLQGQARWRAVTVPASTPAGEPPLQAGRDGGLAWRAASASQTTQPLAARFRLRNVPDAFTMPLQLQIGRGQPPFRRTLTEFEPLGRIEFGFDFTRVLGQYLASPDSTTPCAAGELLVNGSFDRPPSTDASRRLLGLDCGKGPVLIGTVDLSRTVDLSAQNTLTLAFYAEIYSPNTSPSGLQEELIGQPFTINCAGADPGRTTLKEVIAAINRAVGTDVASGQQFLRIDARPMAPPRSVMAKVELPTWIDESVPQGWEAVTDDQRQVLRRRWEPIVASYSTAAAASPPAVSSAPPPERMVAQMASFGGQPVILRQAVTVSDTCAYILRFFFQSVDFATAQQDRALCFPPPPRAAGRTPSPRPPQWQIRWLDAGGRLLRRDTDSLLNQDFEGLNPSWGRAEVHLWPPQGAARADVAIVQPPGAYLLVSSASFQPTFQALANPTFEVWALPDPADGPEQDDFDFVLPGWTAASGLMDMYPAGAPLAGNDPRGVLILDAHQFDEPAHDAPGVQLHGEGSEDAVLSQILPVNAGQTYTLEVRARPQPSPRDGVETLPPEKRARVEIRWLGPATGGTSSSSVSPAGGVPAGSTSMGSGSAPARPPGRRGPSSPSPAAAGGGAPVPATGATAWSGFLVQPIESPAGSSGSGPVSVPGPLSTAGGAPIGVASGTSTGISSAPGTGGSSAPGSAGPAGAEAVTGAAAASAAAVPAPDTPLEVVILDGRDFPQHAWRGVAPAGAARAELRLIQPVGPGKLVVEQVYFTQVDLVPAPLIFLSQAPGDLSVSGLHVTFDLPSLPDPAAPPGALAGQPKGGVDTHVAELIRTAPNPLSMVSRLAIVRSLEARAQQSQPAPAPTEEAVLVDLRKVEPPAAVPASEPASPEPPPLIEAGASPEVKAGPASGLAAQPAPEGPAEALHGAAAEEPGPPEGPEEEPGAEPAGPPLTAIAGIGAARAQRLVDAGIDSVARLAAAAPEDVAEVLLGVKVDVAQHFIEEAQALLRSSAAAGEGEAPRPDEPGGS